MADKQRTIGFPGVSAAEANRAAASLSEALRDIDPTVSVETVRDRPDAQDFGATLVLVLGTASISALSKGISSWIARSGTKLEITEGGHVLGTGSGRKEG